MDHQYSWKRTEVTEIDLADLLYRFCRQWKWITVCAVVFAVMLGMYGWMKNGGRIQESPEMDAEMVLTESEKQAVAAAVLLDNEIRGLQAYLDQSVLMQIDAYHKNRFVMLYSIEEAKRRELPKITESYFNYILNGAAADALYKTGSSEWNIDKNCLAELISAYQKTYSFPYQVTVNSQEDSGIMSESLFYVEVIGKSADAVKKMARDVQKILEEYTQEAVKTAGNHKLKLISTSAGITADSGLLTQQHDKKTLLASNLTNLKTMTDAFSREQMAVYQEAAGTEEIEEHEYESSNASINDINSAYSDTYRSGIKYAAAGFIGGIFVYFGIFLLWYLFCDTVKSVKEMKRMYLFPVYSGMSAKERQRKKEHLFQRRCSSAGDDTEKTLNRIRLACMKKEAVRVCAVSDITLSPEEKECIKGMAEKLGNWGIGMVLIENTGGETQAWDKLADIGNVLLVCRTGTTTYQMIDDTMACYLENHIAMLGAIAF